MSVKYWYKDGKRIVQSGVHILCETCPCVCAGMTKCVNITLSGVPNANIDGSWPLSTDRQSPPYTGAEWETWGFDTITWTEGGQDFRALVRLEHEGTNLNRYFILFIRTIVLWNGEWYRDNDWWFRLNATDPTVPRVCEATGTYREADRFFAFVDPPTLDDVEVTIVNEDCP